MTSLTPERRAELLKLCENATPAPWDASLANSGRIKHVWTDGEGNRTTRFLAEFFKTNGHENEAEANVLLVIAARTALPECLAALSEAEDTAHYANGVAELAMKHRDIAEAEIERLKSERDRAREIVNHGTTSVGQEVDRWKFALSMESVRADRLQAERDAERERCARLEFALQPFARAGNSPACAPGSNAIRESNITDCIAWSYYHGDDAYRVMLTDFRAAAAAIRKGEPA